MKKQHRNALVVYFVVLALSAVPLMRARQVLVEDVVVPIVAEFISEALLQ